MLIKKVEYDVCHACCYARGEFNLQCGMTYENEKFTLSQDWDLPIPGFMVASPKRCIENLEEF